MLFRALVEAMERELYAEEFKLKQV